MIKNGSADNAGLQKGDKIFSIDGVLVKDLSVSEGIELMASAEDIEGFNTFMKKYVAGLSVEQAAVVFL